MIDTPKQTRLAKLAAGASNAPAASSVSTPLAKRQATNGRRGAERDLPYFGRVWIELPGARLWQETEIEIRRVMLASVGELSLVTAGNWEAERAMRVCAIAVRDPDDHAAPFGTLEQWGELDNDVIGPAWTAFGEVRDELDPLSQPLGEDDVLAISIAIKKKDVASLRKFDAVKLRAYLLSTESPPSTSPTPSSPSGALESASSDST